jgi:hypothetical protein
MNYEQYILEHFHYSDGTLTRDDRNGGTGSIDKDGYLIIKVKGKQFKAHRIVWLLHHGIFPKREIDHINRNKLDNRIDNLRESNRQEQVENRDYQPNPDTGVVGVYEDKCTKGLKKKYTTRIKHKTYRFYTVQDAAKFRKEHGLWV